MWCSREDKKGRSYAHRGEWRIFDQVPNFAMRNSWIAAPVIARWSPVTAKGIPQGPPRSARLTLPRRGQGIKEGRLSHCAALLDWGDAHHSGHQANARKARPRQAITMPHNVAVGGSESGHSARSSGYS